MDFDRLLEIKNLYFNINGKDILKDINLTVKKGEILPIIGVNGTGKSTLASIIMGLNGYKPTRGRIIFKGEDITGLSVTARAKLGITLAWQIPANFEGIAVREYLSINNKMSPEEALNFVGLNPKSYMDRILDDSLSGGERKRIELASVLSIKPSLVILDEPDSGIDIASMDIILNVIRELKKNGSSVILITHSKRMATIADKLVLMCNGKIVKKGDAKQIIKFFEHYCKSCEHIGKIDEGVLNEL